MEGLSALTGYCIDRLHKALLDLRYRDYALALSPGPACPRCTARFPGGEVMRYYADHDAACPSHRLWLGPAYQYRDLRGVRYVDISPVPEVLAAQTRHRRMIQGPWRISGGFDLAKRLLSNEWPSLSTMTETLLERLGVSGERPPLGDPRLRAAQYPREVRIARLFASPHWLRTSVLDRGAFLAELGVRLHGDAGYVPHGNSLAHRWLDEQLASYHNGRRRFHFE